MGPDKAGRRRLRVIAKQPNSRMCLVCGLENPAGLRAFFYELESGELLAFFCPRPEHQGYPGRLHGGIATAILDETIGRAVMKHHAESAIWGVTIEISTRFKQPVPMDEGLRVVARLTRETRRGFEGSGELILADNTVAVSARGRYFKMDLEKIADLDPDHLDWQVTASEDDPDFVEL
ncbi:MAG: PaaI family thioesterase [Desulfobacterales bacterium]|nr:PaaI family thioesterase [Desulfobacterales bacterium]